MHRFFLISIVFLAMSPAQRSRAAGWEWIVPKLREVNAQRQAAENELEKLGAPMVGQTSAEIGYQREHDPSPNQLPHHVQIDLPEQCVIDSIALIPAVMDWHSAVLSAYAFPVRFRLEIAQDPQFDTAVTVGEYTAEDFPNPGLAPVTIPVGGKLARYVRLTVTKMTQDDGRYFFALSEIMVLSGNLDVAIGSTVHASASVEVPPRFSKNYLIDGRTPLGLPIKRELLEWDGLHAGNISNAVPPWMRLDLGRDFLLQQVRLYPVHARIGVNLPGFRFPKSLRVEASETPDFARSTVLLDARNYSNPGDNPVTIPVDHTKARYVKVTAYDENGRGGPRFSLSEMEVYADGRNVARSATVARSSDPFQTSKSSPESILVDGYTSYGRLMELPDWLHDWEKRRGLQKMLHDLDGQKAVLLAVAYRRAAWSGGGIAAAALVAVVAFSLAARQRQERALHDLRLRLARDLHDEIGSNLASIAGLSELAHESHLLDPAQQTDWQEVNKIARETLGAMREVIWVTGGKEEAGLDLMAHLQLAAARLLAGKEIHWTAPVSSVPAHWTMETKREIFLLFKEALTNILRHAHASRVEISAQFFPKEFVLIVTDNGCGFDPDKAPPGVGLASQQMRARTLGGTVKISTPPGGGTQFQFKMPLAKTRPFFSFGKKMPSFEV